MNILERPELGREIASTRDGLDITRGFVGPLLMPGDSVLRARGAGDLGLYEQVLADSEVKAALSQRQLAVTQCEWQVEPGGPTAADAEAADFLRGQLHAIGWDNITTKMLYGVFYGFAVAEIIYRPGPRHVEIEAIRVRNRRRFRFSPEGGLRLLTPTNLTQGIPAEAPYFWSFHTGADNDDEPYGLGLAHWLYWPVLFKRNGVKFWLMFLEKFGMPTAVGRYDAEASSRERALLLEATRAIQADSGIIMPKGMELDLVEAARSGTADYEALFNAMNTTIQKVVLGQTASTQGTAGRLGNDQLQASVRDDLIKADADLVCESFNLGPVRWLTQWNFPNATPPRVYRVTEASEDLDKLAERDERLTRIGYRPSAARIERVFGEGYERIEAHPAGGFETDPASFAAPAAPDYLDVLAEVMAARTGEAVADWVGRIEAEVNQAQSFDDLMGRLSQLLTDLPLDEIGQIVAQGHAAVNLAGQLDARLDAETDTQAPSHA